MPRVAKLPPSQPARLRAPGGPAAAHDAAAWITTQYTPLRAVLGVLERMASSDSAVLIVGEPGTGKTRLARAIHRTSGRSGPHVEVDCAAFQDAQIDIELFGLERRPLNAPATRRLGALEVAAGGTLTLEGPGTMSADVQGKLARAMERGAFERIGDTDVLSLRVRFVSIVTETASADAGEGAVRLRPELRERLSTVRVEVPPLRQRGPDIAVLAERFREEVLGRDGAMFTADAIALLEAHDWPGNVRELRTVVARAAARVRGPEIRAQDLAIGGGMEAGAEARAGGPLTLAELERRHIEAVLVRTAWHQGKAAKALGISSKTLYRKIREFGLVRPATP